MKFIFPRIAFAFAVLSIAALACSAPIDAAPAITHVTPTTASPAQQPTTLPATAQPTVVQTAAAPTIVSPSPSVPPTTAPTVNQVTIYFVALEDGGKSGPKIGCGDSLVAVTQPVTPTTQPIQAALQALFAVKDQHVGQSGLYNALYQSNLVVDSVNILPSGLAEVALSGQMQLGGVCDSPRFKAQIEQTIMAQPGISAANVTINGVGIDQVLSQK